MKYPPIPNLAAALPSAREAISIGRTGLLAAIALLAGGCGQQTADPANRAAGDDQPAPAINAPADAPFAPAPNGPRPATATTPVAPLLGEKLARAEWSKAANRATCAPLGLKSDAGAGGAPRPATFSGGWAVAFDQPDRRSAYGLAGVGVLPDDKLDFALLVDRIAKQWPYIRRWDSGGNLPAGSAAGYGLEGFQDYPSGSSGFGRQSVAYLRIPGQQCLYNIWSKLGRDHLELLLDQLVLLRP